MRRLLFRTIHDVALMLDREREARGQSPSAAVVESQWVKAPSAPSGGGYDAGNRIKERKRHIPVDTDGRLLMANLTTADISDSAGAQEIVATIRRRWPSLKHLFGDGAYDRTKLLDAAALRDFTVEIIHRSDDISGFKVLPRRWVVERTFGWLTRWRRLVRDYEKRLDVSEAMIHPSYHGQQHAPAAHPLNGQPMHEPEIITTDNGFAIVTGKGTDTVSFDEVSAIVAYKLDELTTDLICCDIVTGAGDAEQIRTIHEELPGFEAVMARIEMLSGFDRKWRDDVIDPPFATNRTVIYTRSVSA